MGQPQGADLTGANLQEVTLRYANLQEARLDDANLQGASLAEANLQDARFADANLQDAYLRYANLQGAILWGNLQGASFADANLQDASFWVANLQGADLRDANLQGADLRDANLRGADNLTVQQIITVSELLGATMPDGARYDGRFNLQGNLEAAKRTNVDLENSSAMATFYGVTLEEYRFGQLWADENLPRPPHEAGSEPDEFAEYVAQLVREAGLEQEEAAETGEAPQPEEPPSNSGPPSPVVPARSLLSFTVRRLIGLFWPFIL